jgi:hypothetical protein
MPDISAMIPVAKLFGPEVIELAKEAESFLAGQRWCKTITGRYLAWALAPKVGVFYFQLEPVRNGDDKELWVIVGDLPPAYIVCDNAQTWQQALDAYAVEMMEWVKAVREGRSVDNVIPVNVPPNLEYADMLETRCNLIWEMFVDVPPESLPTDT